MTKATKTVPVSSLKLMRGQVPTFPVPLTIKFLNGDESTVTLTAKAMRKTEWAKLRDEFMQQSAPATESGEVAPFTFANAISTDMTKGAAMVASFATGWDLDDEFTVNNLMDLEDQFGGTLAAALQAFDAAIFHGRLGN